MSLTWMSHEPGMCDIIGPSTFDVLPYMHVSTWVFMCHVSALVYMCVCVCVYARSIHKLIGSCAFHAPLLADLSQIFAALPFATFLLAPPECSLPRAPGGQAADVNQI
mmetsp:Transcript_16297/g.26121  ORF Transcript_16297/g.26121 Transcript_16297/m.26121 type:complete len:108 (-) Transcript_16297:1370-1693(-)